MAIKMSKSKSNFDPKSTYRQPPLSAPKVSFKYLLKALYRVEYERTYHKPPPKAKEFPYITMEPILPRLEPDAYERIAQRLNYLRALDVILERNNDRVESKWTVTSSIKSNWKMVNEGTYGTAIKELSEVWKWEKGLMNDKGPEVREWCRGLRYPYVGEVKYGTEKGDPGYEGTLAWVGSVLRTFVKKMGVFT
ncbi:hypothetical protein HYFRA_00010966 [Hymenoscyphus fraxineus]|uniref:Uncharacterized protein n=1 Tax=Hymenoscyphus fraxineus TaxID=746836 RepID=A0A9N9PTZ1_9HELO|nr:hypothetical protein HYFRA_00010966 [Hymenoscyphus fraxineus]